MGTKTKEDDSTLVKTIDDLFCRFIINDDANIAVHHLAIIFLGTRILKIICHYLANDICKELGQISDRWSHGGGVLKIAIFPMTYFLNEPYCIRGITEF